MITSDRDEKIRISFYKNSYNIQSYLLGHKEFVTQFELIDDKSLVSVSGVSWIEICSGSLKVLILEFFIFCTVGFKGNSMGFGEFKGETTT